MLKKITLFLIFIFKKNLNLKKKLNSTKNSPRPRVKQSEGRLHPFLLCTMIFHKKEEITTLSVEYNLESKVKSLMS